MTIHILLRRECVSQIMTSDCQRGTKSEIVFSGYQTCTSCNASNREYQPDAGESECKVCFGKLNVSEDIVICQPGYR